MSSAIICFGASLGDRKKIIAHAVKLLSAQAKITQLSDVYETIPKEPLDRGPFLNCCAAIETKLSSVKLLHFLQDIQNQLLGEDHEAIHFIQKDIELDLISFEKEVIRTPKLTLPHPSAHRRAFVMIPLASICGDWVHPVLNTSAKELARETYWAGWGTFFAPAKSLLDF
jgi:2-amino-4-hydroxy-6-hydroxymethyldihydropteridine diphosphokinase